MPVFKIEKNNNYTVMSNYHLRDKNLSYKAKGLLSFMLSLPEDGDYSLAGLCSISKEGRDGIRSILKELQECHYLEIEKVRGEKGLIEVKNKIIVDSTHTNAMFHYILPREELIKQAKELRKSIYKIDKSMHEKVQKKREASGILDDQIDYTKELLKIVKDDGRFTVLPGIKEQVDYLEETMNDTEIELEYSKDQDVKIGHKTADTSFFGYKTHIAMTPERIVTAATITSGEKHDGQELVNLI